MGPRKMKITGRMTVVPKELEIPKHMEKLVEYVQRNGIDLSAIRKGPTFERLRKAIARSDEKGARRALFRALAEQDPLRAIDLDILSFRKKGFVVGLSIRGKVNRAIRKKLDAGSTNFSAYLAGARLLKRLMKEQSEKKREKEAVKIGPKERQYVRLLLRSYNYNFLLNKLFATLSSKKSRLGRIRKERKGLLKEENGAVRHKARLRTLAKQERKLQEEIPVLVKKHEHMTETLSDSLRVAGINPSIFYRNFPKKREVAAAIVLVPLIVRALEDYGIDPQVRALAKQFEGEPEKLKKALSQNVKSSDAIINTISSTVVPEGGLTAIVDRKKRAEVKKAWALWVSYFRSFYFGRKKIARKG